MFLQKHSYICSVIIMVVYIAAARVAPAQVGGNNLHDHRLFPCLEDGLKANKVGCQLLARMQVSRFVNAPLFWHLNKFSTRGAAEAAKGQTGLVVEAEGQFWLFSFGPKSAAPKQGQLVASVGPLQLTSEKLPLARSYEIVAYLAVMPPNTYSRVHTHPGPEAWYILSGQQCLETPAGAKTARAGKSMFASPTTPMRLTNNGSSTRRALFIVIHDANQPWSIPTDDWKPIGTCDRKSDGERRSNTITRSPFPDTNQQEPVMTKHASGTFEVKLNPQVDDKVEDPTVGRMSIDKEFHGDLEGTSKGQMLAVSTDVKGSAGYVAMERVNGKLGGRSGSFALQHSGTLTRGAAQLSVTVAPDSGTGDVVGLTRNMTIKIVEGKHSYEFAYTLGQAN